MQLPANRIRKAREIQGLNRTQVAAHIGVTERTVRRWEEGDSSPHDRQKMLLSELFGIDVPYLMGWADGSNGNNDHESEAA